MLPQLLEEHVLAFHHNNRMLRAFPMPLSAPLWGLLKVLPAWVLPALGAAVATAAAGLYVAWK